MSSDKTNTGQYYINMRLVYALRSVGKGHDDAKIICTLLDIPGPPTRFMKYNRIIATTIKKVAEKSMIEAVQEVVDKTENSDLTVAIDGSWQKKRPYLPEWSCYCNFNRNWQSIRCTCSV